MSKRHEFREVSMVALLFDGFVERFNHYRVGQHVYTETSDHISVDKSMSRWYGYGTHIFNLVNTYRVIG